ncbi:uncharacterized protein LOC142813994 [Rhipicephalus microplus]|uniref:uncharacterized protein LOC142813994 n=1 Tax=Rhipicephalus microplus TaxID=6941 RepID=UPI003F6BE744
MTVLNSDSFENSLMDARYTLLQQKIYGLGIIKDLPSLITWNRRKPYLKMTYERFNFHMLRTFDVFPYDTKNFVAFRPDDTFTPQNYHNHLSLLNSIDGLSIVIILTITDENMLEVVPSSSWNRSCLPQMSQPTMEEAVSAILSIPDPKVNYTLTVSLCLDNFHSSIIPLFNKGPPLWRYYTRSHKSFFFKTTCRTQIYSRDPQGVNIYYYQGGSCAFTAGPTIMDDMVTLKTPRSLRQKMRETYHMIGYSKTDTYVVGWTVYNVTNCLAPTDCGGYHNRISEIRKIIDENKEL